MKQTKFAGTDLVFAVKVLESATSLKVLALQVNRREGKVFADAEILGPGFILQRLQKAGSDITVHAVGMSQGRDLLTIELDPMGLQGSAIVPKVSAVDFFIGKKDLIQNFAEFQGNHRAGGIS